MPGLRLDRALTLSPFPRLLKLGRQPRVPVLMYHGIRDGIGTKHPYFETNTSPTVFERHLRFLRDQGYTTVHLSDVLQAFQTAQDGRRILVITFDDGYRDFYTEAFPLLTQYGFKATMFVVSDFVAMRNDLGPQGEFMTWQELREVSTHGVQIGSHSVSHPNLYRSSCQELENEIKLSKQVIENKIGQPVRSFAYPFAFPEPDRAFVQRLAGLLEASAYDNGVSTVIGTACRNHNRFFWPRLPVNSFDDLPFFRAKLDGHYDWLRTPQYIYKSLKGFISFSSHEQATLSA